jgi:hypothetical protein
MIQPGISYDKGLSLKSGIEDKNLMYKKVGHESRVASVNGDIPLCINGCWIAGSVLLASLQQAVDQCGGFIAELLAHQLERIFPR